ncbi:MAG: hypothetical protein M1838_001077 [Thelocarpon superellum]|nr:MAG: hypothetical protein M1838_001077 [Thelocarpon superellum]
MFQYTSAGPSEGSYQDLDAVDFRRYPHGVTSNPNIGYGAAYMSTSQQTHDLRRPHGLDVTSFNRSTSTSPGSPGAPSPEGEDEGEYDEAEEDDDDHGSHSSRHGGDRTKMKRFRLTHNQTRFLMSEFARQAHPDAAHRERLSREIPGLSPRQVQVWFQNRRAKLKRMTSDDRERMMRSRALPEHFDTTQALRSPLGEGSRSQGTMITPPFSGPSYAELGGSLRPSVSSPASFAGDELRRGYVDPPRSAGLSPPRRSASDTAGMSADQVALKQYQRALEEGPKGLERPLGERSPYHGSGHSHSDRDSQRSSRENARTSSRQSLQPPIPRQPRYETGVSQHSSYHDRW